MKIPVYCDMPTYSRTDVLMKHADEVWYTGSATAGVATGGAGADRRAASPPRA